MIYVMEYMALKDRKHTSRLYNFPTCCYTQTHHSYIIYILSPFKELAVLAGCILISNFEIYLIYKWQVKVHNITFFEQSSSSGYI